MARKRTRKKARPKKPPAKRARSSAKQPPRPANIASERSVALWMEEKPVRCPQLTKKISADVVVIGSGVAGLTVAHELTKQGASVAVLDRGEIARGISAR